VQAALQASVDRIQSMALIHQFLYRSDTQDSFDFRTFADSLIGELSDTYLGGRPIELVAEVPHFELDLQRAVPVGLILNELVTNALKYAFPDGRRGTISVTFSHMPDEMVQLTVSDDGVGLPDGFDPSAHGSMGMTLVRALTEQISGTVRIEPAASGTTFVIVIPGQQPDG
jgi:two-component sensor histidine kinase